MDTRMSDPSVAMEALAAGMLMWTIGRLGRELAEERDWHSTWKVTGCCKRIERKKIRIVAAVGRWVVSDAFDHLSGTVPYNWGIRDRRLRATAILWTGIVASHVDETLDMVLKGPMVFECGMLHRSVAVIMPPLLGCRVMHYSRLVPTTHPEAE